MRLAPLLGAFLVVAACGGESGQGIPAPPAEASSPNEPMPSGSGYGTRTGSADAAGADAGDAPPSEPDGGAVDGPWPGSQVFFFTFPDQRPITGTGWGTALMDILRHLHPTFASSQYEFPNDRIRWGHETTHGIASHLRFAYNVTGKPANGFYVLQHRATLVVEPAMKLADVAPRVPPSLRGPRWQQHLVEAARYWNDVPTYVLEEWVAFTNGSEVGVDLVEQGLWGTSVQDGVFGTLELTIYALAFALAIEERDPAYPTQNPLTREFIAWNAERAMRLYVKGSQMAPFASYAQEDYFAKWKASPDAAPLRNFARRYLGGAYVTKVLGITAPME